MVGVLLITIAPKMRIAPVVNFKRAAFSVLLISPKKNNEQITAKGTTALLKTARVPGFDWVAPLFHKKKPMPDATNPR